MRVTGYSPHLKPLTLCYIHATYGSAMSEESKAEKFLEIFNKGKEFTEELLRENQRLRYRLLALENEAANGPSEEVQRLREQIAHLTDENRRIQQRLRDVDEEN